MKWYAVKPFRSVVGDWRLREKARSPYASRLEIRKRGKNYVVKLDSVFPKYRGGNVESNVLKVRTTSKTAAFRKARLFMKMAKE